MFPRLKILRELNNLTQEDISEILEISKPLYVIYESGEKLIPVELLRKLAKYYKTSIDYLVGDTDEFSPHGLQE